MFFATMINLEVKTFKHGYAKNSACPEIEPNVKEDTLFLSEGVPVGFFLKSIPKEFQNILNIANAEFLTDRVPKSNMTRISGVKGEKTSRMQQFSTIIGSVPPKPVFRRHYPTVSSVHAVKTAATFIKAMNLLVTKGEDILKDIMPDQYDAQMKIFKEVEDKWKFGNIFTSSISNFNIAANFHRDTRNIKNTVNFIFTRRRNSKGGNLFVPDHNLCIDQSDCSLLVYPAWKSLHAVTPIVETAKGGYRNSFVFYPLSSFEKSETG